MLLTVAEYAQRRGVAVNTVYYAIRMGRITRRDDQMIDAEAADKDWASRRHSDRGPGRPVSHALAEAKATNATNATFLDARTERELWEGKLKQLTYRERTGELIEKRVIELAAENRHRMLQQTLMQIPLRMAPQLALETDEKKVQDILAGELRRVLTDFISGRLG